MKNSLLALAFVLATIAVAHASPFKGKYYAVSYNEYDQVDAALNLTVKGDGTLVGHGSTLDLGTITVSGNAKNNGKLVYKEGTGPSKTKSKGAFKDNGQKFTIFMVDDTLYGAKISSGFPQAGVYKMEVDSGDEGIFIVYADGGVYSHLVGSFGGYEIMGKVKGDEFNGETANYQVGFSGTIDGDTITGTYSDNAFTQGKFTATKY